MCFINHTLNSKLDEEGALKVAVPNIRDQGGAREGNLPALQLTEDWGAAPRASCSTHTPVLKADDQ